MRPHRLEVTAFGAFAGTVEVCFRDLAAAGLFLLHGETGAGKTTLLDAIGFALYGRVPGPRGQARRLRSDHADESTRTQVRLEVTIGGRLLRVTRSPEQARRKRRGSGTTTEPVKVLLEEHADGSWRVLSSRVGEADTEITDLMGMSADQFFQVVLLPQSEFARFLHAGAQERGKLLERLFRTDRFRAVEEWLAEQRRRTARQVDEARGEVATLAARIAQVAAVAEPGEQMLRSAASLAGWAAALTASASAAAAAARQDAAARLTDLDLALDRRSAAQRLADRQQRRATAHRRYAELAQAAPAVGRVRRELDAAARAAEIAGALSQADDAATRLAEARAVEEDARRAAAADGAADGTAIDALRAAASETRERVGRLKGCAKSPRAPKRRMRRHCAPRIARRSSRASSRPARVPSPNWRAGAPTSARGVTWRAVPRSGSRAQEPIPNDCAMSPPSPRSSRANVPRRGGSGTSTHRHGRPHWGSVSRRSGFARPDLTA